jgi:hypothetical protein
MPAIARDLVRPALDQLAKTTPGLHLLDDVYAANTVSA